MNGFLMLEKSFVKGRDTFFESYAPENNYGVVFEDDEETAYFYAVEKAKDGEIPQILDALHIYESENFLSETISSKLVIVWSRDWLKSALVLDGLCHAVFDFVKQAGYNINQFPPPNEFWTKADRKLTNELIAELF
jgi:hypothetical protein